MQSESNSQSRREAELQAVKRWLEVLGQNWLLILDNADNLNIEPGLTHFIPSENMDMLSSLAETHLAVP